MSIVSRFIPNVALAGVTVALALAIAAPANAVPLPGIPAGSSDGMYIPGSGYGPAFLSESNAESTLVAPVNPSDVISRPQFNNFYGILLTEPRESSSDLVYYDSGGGIHLVSDNETSGVITGIVTVIATVPETGRWQDVGQYFFNNGQSLYVVSDVAATPLPAALPLFAGGLGVMGFLAGRRKRKNAAALVAA